MMRGQRFKLQRALTLLAALSAGCGMTDIQLGEAMTSIDLADCYGEGTSCEPEPVEPTPLLKDESPRCTVEDAPDREVAWAQMIKGTIGRAVIDANNILWIVAHHSYGGLKILRYSPDGELLSTSELRFGEGYRYVELTVADLAVDVDGHAYLGTITTVADRSTNWQHRPMYAITEIDSEGIPTPSTIAVEGLIGSIRLGTGPDGSLLVAAFDEDGRAALGKLGPDHALRWVQSSLPQTMVYKISGTEDGRSVVFGAIPSTVPFQYDETVALYDGRGNLEWILEPKTSSEIKLDIGDDGDFVLLTSKQLQPNVIATDIIVASVNAGGEQRWVLAIGVESSGPIETVSRDGDGSVYFAAWDGWIESEDGELLRETDTLYHITQDGAHCYRSVVATVPETERAWLNVLAARDGTLFFYTSPTQVPSNEFHVGALAPEDAL